MSALITTLGTWAANVTVGLTDHSQHNHVPSPVAPHFQPPIGAPSLTFGPVALAAAIARTATTGPGSVQLLAALETSVLGLLQCLVSDNGVFELTADFANLADAEKAAFAGRCGAGITDLYMNAMGYTWRANAACLGKPLEAHADFIYDGGSAAGHGVVLAEAHGSFAANVTAKTIHAKAKKNTSGRSSRMWTAVRHLVMSSMDTVLHSALNQRRLVRS